VPRTYSGNGPTTCHSQTLPHRQELAVSDGSQRTPADPNRTFTGKFQRCKSAADEGGRLDLPYYAFFAYLVSNLSK